MNSIKLCPIKIKGQGLIEMLAIVLFIGCSIAAILSFQNYLAYSSNLIQQRSDAALLATNEIETLKNFSSLTAYQSIASSSNTTTIGNTTYTSTWTITTTASPIYKTASVVVTWTDRYGNSQSVTQVTDIAGLDPSIPASYM
jgi:Tfp pilus assembly protein PilV